MAAGGYPEINTTSATAPTTTFVVQDQYSHNAPSFTYSFVGTHDGASIDALTGEITAESGTNATYTVAVSVGTAQCATTKTVTIAVPSV